jgi:hypothetical protein
MLQDGERQHHIERAVRHRQRIEAVDPMDFDIRMKTTRLVDKLRLPLKTHHV